MYGLFIGLLHTPSVDKALLLFDHRCSDKVGRVAPMCQSLTVTSLRHPPAGQGGGRPASRPARRAAVRGHERGHGNVGELQAGEALEQDLQGCYGFATTLKS